MAVFFYYIKLGGTATGDGGRYATEKVGSWATAFSATSEYYNSLEECLDNATTKPTGEDSIRISHLHLFDSGNTEIRYELVTPPSAPIEIISVDDANVDTPLAGAAEDAGTADTYFRGYEFIAYKFYGFKVLCDEPTIGGVGSNISLYMKDSFFELLGNDQITVYGVRDSHNVHLDHCNIHYTTSSANSTFDIRANGKVVMHGGSITGDSNVGGLIYNSSMEGGMRGEFVGVDLSVLTGPVISATGAQSADDFIDVLIKGCPLSTTNYCSEVFNTDNKLLKVIQSGATAAIREYQYFQRTWAGDVNAVPGSNDVCRVQSIPLQLSGEKVSLKLDTRAECEFGRTLDINLKAYVPFSSGKTKCRIYISQPNSNPALNNENCYIEANYIKDSDSIYEVITTEMPIMGTPTILSVDLDSDWEDGGVPVSGFNKYYIDVEMDGVANPLGQDCVVDMVLHVASPSAAIYVEPVVGVL